MSRLEQVSNWSAHPYLYDYMHCIDVENQELIDGGGQHLSLICNFSWEIQVVEQTPEYEWGTVRFTYRQSPRHPEYWPDLQSYSQKIKYKLTSGRFLIPSPMTSFGTIPYESQLGFECDPFPRLYSIGLWNLLERVGEPLVFYGPPVNRALSLQLHEAKVLLTSLDRAYKARLRREGRTFPKQKRVTKFPTLWTAADRFELFRLI